MFGIGLPEMILILALALIVVGPDKLPELARSVAKGVLELKKTVSALKEDLAEDNPLDSVKPELEEAAQSIKKQLGDATPDGFTGVVNDLKEGLQEVIDKDGTVIPVDTDDIIETVAGTTDSEVDPENSVATKPEVEPKDDPAVEQVALTKDIEPEVSDRAAEPEKADRSGEPEAKNSSATPV